MSHAESLTAIALALGAALLFGLFMSRLRLPVMAGFILAGVALGPSGLGLIATTEEIQELADMGVLMLLFIIGMELRLQSFSRLLPTALGIAGIEIAVMTALALLVAHFAQRQTASAIVIGFMLAISSTAVAMKMIEDAEENKKPAGRLAHAILIAQDLAVVPLIFISDALGSGATKGWMVVIAFKLGLSIVLLVGFMALLLRVKSYRFPFSRAVLKSNDFATLAVCGVCFGSATVSALLGLSPALGAFLGGIGVGHSTLRRPAVSVAGPIYSILLFAFFFSVGLLIDVQYVWRELWLVGIALVIVAGGKTLLNYVALRIFRQPHATAFLVALFLAPIGEFSFVLAESASESGVMTPEGRDLAIDVVALSLLVSPLWYLAARRAHRLAIGPLHSDVTTAPAAPDAPGPPGPGG